MKTANITAVKAVIWINENCFYYKDKICMRVHASKTYERLSMETFIFWICEVISWNLYLDMIDITYKGAFIYSCYITLKFFDILS